MIGLSIDPGLSTGVCLYRFDDNGYEPLKLWQFGHGRQALIGFLNHHGVKPHTGLLRSTWGDIDRLVVEKFTPWSDGEKEFSLTSDAVEPLRCEGALTALGLEPFINWGQPSQQYFIGSSTLPKDEKRKLAKGFLKKHGFYITGSTVGRKDAEDAISAQLHAIADLRRMRHMPTLFQLFGDK